MSTRTVKAPSETIDACRACGSTRLDPFLDLGTTPLADRLLTERTLKEPELVAPLQVVFCADCTLVQITETVAPEVLFGRDYPYYSSVSESLLRHFRSSALELVAERELGAASLVVEAASNDGYMLKNFIEAGVPVLGIDPAAGPAKAAEAAGVPTMNTFFTRELGEQLRAEGRRADVFLANNVLAHVADLNGFVAGAASVLADDGVAVIEAPYLLDLIDHVEFDTIYHQHLCYFSVHALDHLFARHGLHLNRVVRTPIHGGSLRLFVGKRAAREKSVDDLLTTERSRGADQPAFYRSFSDRVITLKDALLTALHGAKGRGDAIAGYGAAAKACTLLTFCGIDRELLDYLVDKNPHKHGLYMGGNHLLIRPTETLLEDMPDAVLVLVWNFADEVMRQQDEYRRRGGRFIIPVPEVRVVS